GACERDLDLRGRGRDRKRSGSIHRGMRRWGGLGGETRKAGAGAPVRREEPVSLKKIALTLIALLVSCLALPVESADAPKDGIRVQVGKGAVQGLLAGATPYRLEVGTSLLKETLNFSDPRDLVFEPGRIRFAIRCQGSPFPLDQVLHPAFSLQTAGGVSRLVVESLPVSVPGFGVIDLKEMIPPIELQSLLRQTLLLQGKPAQLEVKVDRVTILTDRIEIDARLLLASVPVR